uniref:Maturation protein n=1 Tax=Shahe levi-like virus 3 TaxID=1923428 RepID=A0A1L3KIJ6_9VIRU|nr:hypothetical protein [Shahe levi-like virus 3]
MTNKFYQVGDANGSYYEERSQIGTDTPKHLRKKGLWPVNPYVGTRAYRLRTYSKIQDPWGNTHSSGPWRVDDFVQLSNGQPQYPAFADLLIKLREKWSDTDLNLGMYLSPEGRDSLQMMGNSMLRLANSARSLKRGDFGGFVRNLNDLPRSDRKVSARKFNQGDISGAFLAAHLGWEPLIKDTYEASQLVNLEEESVRVSARKLGSLGSTAIGIDNYPGATLTTDNKVQLQLTLNMTRKPTFSQRFGLDNPFLIAWELVPLSFVADYFLPIGRVIAGMGAVSALYGSRGWQKAYSRRLGTITMPKGTAVMNLWGVPYALKNDIKFVDSFSRFERSVYSPSFSDPLRGLKVTLPDGVWKLSTLAALTHQRIISLSKK